MAFSFPEVFFFTFSNVVCFVYCVILSSVCVLLSSVCVDLLQVPGLTALAYILVSQNCASGNEMFCSHFNLRIFFSISQAVHCLERQGVPLSIYTLGRSLTLAKWAMFRHTAVNA